MEQTGARVAPSVLRRAFFETPVVPDGQLRSAAALLKVFAEHLALLETRSRSGPQTRIRALSGRRRVHCGHLQGPLSLARVGGGGPRQSLLLLQTLSPGGDVTFKEYVSRARVERAKQLLLDPNKRVSEACFEVGFPFP